MVSFQIEKKGIMIKSAKILLLSFVMSLTIALSAQDIKFSMNAPSVVRVGEQFRLTLIVDGSAKADDVHLPSLGDFQKLFGPSVSQSQRVSVVNGQTTKQIKVVYTYVLVASKKGKFELRSASAKVEGKVYESNSVNIEVVSGDATPQQQGQGQQQNQNKQAQASGRAGDYSQGVGKDDIFASLSLNKRNVYKGEQIIATIKIYKRPDIGIAGVQDIQFPEFEGFWTKELESTKQLDFKREAYNDQIYEAAFLRSFIISPQKAGSLRTGTFQSKFVVQVVVRNQNRTNSIFDQFFSQRAVNYNIEVNTPNYTITSKEPPSPPSDYVGGVGSFSISDDIDKTELTTNDAITYTLKITGKGNLNLIQIPKLNVPSDFESFDPDITSDIKSSVAGTSGSKTFKYVFIPRAAGDYEIPAMTMSYFDPSKKDYVRLTTKPYKVSVTKGTGTASISSGTAVNREDLDVLNKDIRHINENMTSRIRKYATLFIYSSSYWLLIIATLLVFAVVLWINRKRAKLYSDESYIKNKRAYKMIRKHLKSAQLYVKSNDAKAFYPELLTGYWNYFNHKLNIPLSQLNRDMALTSLTRNGVDESTVKEFNSIVDVCEFANYAGLSQNEPLTNIYERAYKNIIDIDKQIKK
ncbi:MAG: BatD family protein [Bacteroidales bacterium]